MAPYVTGLHDHMFEPDLREDEDRTAPREVTWEQAIVKGSEMAASLETPCADPSPVNDYNSLMEHGYVEDTIVHLPTCLKPTTRSLGIKLEEFLAWGVNYEPVPRETNKVAGFDFLFHPWEGAIITNYLRSPLVPARRNFPGRASDVLFLGYRHVCLAQSPPISPSRLRYLFVVDVREESSHDAMERAAGRLRPWPGTEFFVRGDDEDGPSEPEEALALLGCPIGRIVGYLLLQHREWFGMKRVRKISVFVTGFQRNLFFEFEEF